MRATPSLTLFLGLLRVTPRVACPLPPLPFPSSPCPPRPSSSFPLGEVLAWCSWGEVLLCCVATVFWGISEICERCVLLSIKLYSKVLFVLVVELHLLLRYDTVRCGTREQATVYSILLLWELVGILCCPIDILEAWMGL